MKNKTFRAFTGILAVLILALSLLTLTGCKDYRKANTDKDGAYVYDKFGNTYPVPTDNDQEGWFSVEVLNQYDVAGFTIPENAKVESKPQRDALYLSGDDTLFATTVRYLLRAIDTSDNKIYTPVFSTDENQTVQVTGLKILDSVDYSSLAPQGDVTSVTFVYESGKNIYQCNISLEETADGADQVYIAFFDKTAEYKDLV